MLEAVFAHPARFFLRRFGDEVAPVGGGGEAGFQVFQSVDLSFFGADRQFEVGAFAPRPGGRVGDPGGRREGEQAEREHEPCPAEQLAR